MYNQPHFRYLEGAGPELSSPGEKEEGLGHQSTPILPGTSGTLCCPVYLHFALGVGKGPSFGHRWQEDELLDLERGVPLGRSNSTTAGRGFCRVG